jgi:hypothetical protein
MANYYKSEAEIEKVVSDFETCRTGKDDFHHTQHLIVATTYLQRYSADAAILRMKEALLRFLNHHAVDPKKYNETLTVFWIEMVARVLQELPEGKSLVEKCNRTVEKLSNPKLALEFYSEELLWSQQARESFVEPDLKHWDE